MLRIDFDNPIIEKDMKEIYERLPRVHEMFGKNIYVSGASGMIASYIVGLFIWLNENLDANINIYAGIRTENKAFGRFGDFINRSYFHILSQDVCKVIDDELHFDYIIHAASLASPQFYGSNPVETMLPNLIGTYNILDYSKRHKVRGILFLSSGAVYGAVYGNDEMLEESMGVLDFLDLGNTYAESKRSGELLCRSYYVEYAVKAMIARVHHTYGPTVDIESDSRVYSEFISNIIKSENIVLKSSGEARRAFCYVTDMVSGLLTILLCGDGGEAYNIGNPGEYISILELAHLLAEHFKDRNIRVISEQRNDSGYRSCAAPLNAPISITKIKKLGWDYKVSLRDGFDRTVKAIEYYDSVEK